MRLALDRFERRLGSGFQPVGIKKMRWVDQTFRSWNPLLGWLRHLEELWRAA
jgi:hypothetical protein